MSIRLMEGDCLEKMRLIPKGSVDMIAADLPYGTTQNKWDSVIPLNILWDHYWRILKGKGVVLLTASQPFTSVLVMSQPKQFKHEWIWIKNRGSNFANTVREPFKEHESVLVFSHGGWTYNKQMQERSAGGLAMTNNKVGHARTTTKNYGKFTKAIPSGGQLRVPSSWQKFTTQVGMHPTQKPVALFEYLIKTYTNPGNLVLDNTMGSGTTGVACVNLKRSFIGIEKDHGYFEIAKKRIIEAMNK